MTPTAISHSEPLARNAGPATNREATSNTTLATHAPTGTVTSIGCNGWPYRPASTVMGRLASYSPLVMPDLLFN